MSSNWKRRLFDHDAYQREDIDTLMLNAELDADNMNLLRKQLAETNVRLDRAELVIEALFMTLENKGLLTPEGFQALLQQVDDLDGTIDGKAGVKLTEG